MADFLSDAWSAIGGWILPVAALAISVLTAIYARRQVHAVREQTTALRDQTNVLRKDLEESQRQWEATGPVFRMEGQFVTVSDRPDQPKTDRLVVTVTNEGRMPGFVEDAYVTDRANLGRHHVFSKRTEIAPHTNQRFLVRRDAVKWAEGLDEWTNIVFAIETGTDETIYLSPHTGRTATSVSDLF